MKQLACILLLTVLFACGSRRERDKQPPEQTALPMAEDSAVQTTGGNPPAVSTDEQQFRTFLGAFRSAADGSQDTLLRNMVHFPLIVDNTGEKVTKQQFAAYRDRIFNGDVKRLLPKPDSGEVRVVDPDQPTAYYKQLRAETDSGTAMYELHQPYVDPVDGRDAFYTFIFGKKNGEYKLMGYHSSRGVRK
ncbi:hypothetical protein ACWKWU_19325 [Chitinophaga lutea]